jgi:hypothetical protein
MDNKPTRRTFLGHASAALAVPLAAASAAGAEQPRADLAGRLAALEDAAAIRALLHRHVQSINTGAAAAPEARVSALHLDADVAIDVARDGTATARAGCSVETATPIDGQDTVVEMARLQGDGVVKRCERRVLAGALVKRGGTWQIERLELKA